jgi:hypothetical protein
MQAADGKQKKRKNHEVYKLYRKNQWRGYLWIDIVGNIFLVFCCDVDMGATFR